MAPTVSDPLLPQGESAPEISGHGFSKRQNRDYHTHQVEVLDHAEEYDAKDEGQAVQSSENMPVLRIMITMFMIVVGFAAFVTLLFPKTFDVPWHSPKGGPSSTKARVDKILSENPLIGHSFLDIR